MPEAPGIRDADWKALWDQAGRVDTVGVAHLAEGDTVSGHEGLTVIESTVRFPEAAAGSEVFAWEIHARTLAPVKLIIVRYDDLGQQYELIGESETLVPHQTGLNRFVLQEPIPVRRGDLYGLHMPAAEAVPFKEVMNWQTLITTRGLSRPFMPRDHFAMYGWRFSARVFYRPTRDE